MNKFSSNSNSKLETCHKDLQVVMNMAIKMSPVDFGISEGHRSVERQQELFQEGKSQLNGYDKRSNHNYSPSKAADIFAYVNSALSYEIKDMAFLAGLIIGLAEILFAQGVITHKIRWGGNFDMDGEIISDQGFVDTPHFEIITI